jgi:hypothetical protein
MLLMHCVKLFTERIEIKSLVVPIKQAIPSPSSHHVSLSNSLALEGEQLHD